MFEWDDARFFLAVHRTSSLSEAGRQLKVNQSTVGRRLHALEERLGGRLFLQTPDGYFLAPAGERLLPHAERMEEEALAIEREASGQEARLTGTVRVTAPDAFGAVVVAPILAELHRKAPGIALELVAENRTLSLTKREADMALRTVRPREGSLIARRICSLASTLYASAPYLSTHGKPRGDDFAAHEFVGFEEETWAESLWLARNGRGARVVMKTNSTIAQLEATRAGMGIGFLPCYLADPDPRLERLLPGEPVVSRGIWLVLHRDLQHAARIRACADLLVDAISRRASDFEGTTSRAHDSG